MRGTLTDDSDRSSLHHKDSLLRLEVNKSPSKSNDPNSKNATYSHATSGNTGIDTSGKDLPNKPKDLNEEDTSGYTSNEGQLEKSGNG